MGMFCNHDNTGWFLEVSLCEAGAHICGPVKRAKNRRHGEPANETCPHPHGDADAHKSVIAPRQLSTLPCSCRRCRATSRAARHQLWSLDLGGGGFLSVPDGSVLTLGVLKASGDLHRASFTAERSPQA